MKCENCKYFKPLTGFTDKSLDGERGDCEKIFEEENVNAPNDVIIFGVGGHYDSIAVGKNFGCIHFENKRQ